MVMTDNQRRCTAGSASDPDQCQGMEEVGG